eukprot:4685565-Amphidinium_carterae.1
MGIVVAMITYMVDCVNTTGTVVCAFCRAGRHRSVGMAVTVSWLLERCGIKTTVLHAEHATWAYGTFNLDCSICAPSALLQLRETLEVFEALWTRIGQRVLELVPRNNSRQHHYHKLQQHDHHNHRRQGSNHYHNGQQHDHHNNKRQGSNHYHNGKQHEHHNNKRQGSNGVATGVLG